MDGGAKEFKVIHGLRAEEDCWCFGTWFRVVASMSLPFVRRQLTIVRCIAKLGLGVQTYAAETDPLKLLPGHLRFLDIMIEGRTGREESFLTANHS